MNTIPLQEQKERIRSYKKKAPKNSTHHCDQRNHPVQRSAEMELGTYPYNRYSNGLCKSELETF